MSDINLTCPHCGNKLVVDAAAAGMSVSCPVCSKPIVIAANEQVSAMAASVVGTSKATRKLSASIFAGMAAIVVLAVTFLVWHSGILSKKKQSSPEVLSAPPNSAPAQLPINPELEKQLVSQANLGEPQAVLGLLDQNPGLDRCLDLLADTPLRWALAQGPANARQLLSETTTKMPALLRETQAPAGSVWLENLESQPETSGKVRPADKSFPDRPQVMDRITYRRGFWSHDRDSSYNVFLNGKAKRLSMLVGLVDNNGKHGHLRFRIMADDQCVGDSGFMVGGQKPKLLAVDLTDVQKLSVRVDTGGNATWANPAIAGALLELTQDENIYAAAVSGRVEELEQLLSEKSPRTKEADRLFGVTPFWAACMGGTPEAAIVVARHDGEVNATNAEGDTILHVAAAKGWSDAIYPACAAGSDPRLRNAAGLTAHEVAAASNNLKVLARLAEAELWLAPLDPVLPAPDFTATDLDGNQVTLSSFKGHVVALFCGSERYAGRLHDLPESKQGKLVVLVATPHNPKSVKTPSPSHAVAGYSTPPDDPNPAQALQNDGYAFRVLFDPQDSIRKTLGLYSAPAVLIDAAGAIIWQRRIERRQEKEDSGLFLATEQVLANHFKFCSTFPGSVTEGKTNSEQVLYDFEDGFQDWKTTGDCWEKSPATDTLYPGLVKGYAGRSFLSTFGSKGFRATGLAISPEFAISKPFLHCLVGGGDLPDRCAVALVSDGCTVKRAGGKNSAELEPVCWDVHGLMGKKVHLEVYDSGAVEPRDFIMLDQVVASDSAAIPASYAKRFDPDDPKSSAEAADGLPAIYKAMQAGEFHEAAVPGPTYRLERTNNVRWPDNEQADWLELTYIPPPTHHGETMRSFSMIVEAGGKSYPSRPFMTGRALRDCFKIQKSLVSVGI